MKYYYVKISKNVIFKKFETHLQVLFVIKNNHYNV
jgi:hypothetical protein